MSKFLRQITLSPYVDDGEAPDDLILKLVALDLIAGPNRDIIVNAGRKTFVEASKKRQVRNFLGSAVGVSGFLLVSFALLNLASELNEPAFTILAAGAGAAAFGLRHFWSAQETIDAFVSVAGREATAATLRTVEFIKGMKDGRIPIWAYNDGKFQRVKSAVLRADGSAILLFGAPEDRSMVRTFWRSPEGDLYLPKSAIADLISEASSNSTEVDAMLEPTPASRMDETRNTAASIGDEPSNTDLEHLKRTRYTKYLWDERVPDEEVKNAIDRAYACATQSPHNPDEKRLIVARCAEVIYALRSDECRHLQMKKQKIEFANQRCFYRPVSIDDVAEGRNDAANKLFLPE